MDKRMAGISVAAFLLILSVAVGSILMFTNAKKSEANVLSSSSYLAPNGEEINVILSSDNYMQDALEMIPKLELKISDMRARLEVDYANDSKVQLSLRLDQLDNKVNHYRNEIYIKNQQEYNEENTGRLGLSYVNQSLVDIITEINEIDSEITVTQ